MKQASTACGRTGNRSDQGSRVLKYLSLGVSHDSTSPSGTSLLAAPGPRRRPLSRRATSNHLATLRPQNPSGSWSLLSLQGQVLRSTPSRVRLPGHTARNFPRLACFPESFSQDSALCTPNPLLLKTGFGGRSSRRSGLAHHGWDQLLSLPTFKLFLPHAVRTRTHNSPQIPIA